MQPLPLYKIVKMWFLPPGVFVVLLAMIAIYSGYSAYSIGRKHKARAINKIIKPLKIICGASIFLAILIYSLSINAISQRLMHSLEYKYSRTDTKVDAIVLISGDFEWEREKAAASLYKKHKVPLVLSSYHKDIYKRMERLGVPKDRLFVDEKAYNTKENVIYSLPLVQKLGAEKIYLVSSANHMPRSMMNYSPNFKKQRIEVVPYPAGYYTPKNHRKDQLEFVPDIRFFNLSNKAWHEYIGMLELWCYRFFGELF